MQAEQPARKIGLLPTGLSFIRLARLMELRIFVEPHLGASYDALLRAAHTAEDVGFTAFFRSDHYLAEGTVARLPGPTDAWTSLAAIARETSSIRLGTLVSPVTFRLPGPLAIVVAQVDAMSNGRVELGLGAGWYAAEHAAYGIPFPPRAIRFEQLREQLEIVRGLWRAPVGERFSYVGTHYAVADSPALPKPLQSGGPPIIIGGRGRTRTPRLAAQYADEYNVPFASPLETAELIRLVLGACRAQQRAPASIVCSAAVTVCCGSTAWEVRRRLEKAALHAAATRAAPLSGSPAAVADKLRAYTDAGVRRIYLQILDLDDLEHLALIAEEVMPQL